MTIRPRSRLSLLRRMPPGIILPLRMPDAHHWIVRDDDSAPVGDVAVRLLRARLDTVWSELSSACAVLDAMAGVPSGNTEHVHQLRVATRRTLAAFDAFRTVIPAKRRSWFVKRLIRLRRVAGEARDLDVLTARLSLQESSAVRARQRLVSMLSKQRSRSRDPIRKLRESLLEDDWPGHVERLLERVAGRRRQPSFGRYARSRFKPLVEEFFAAADHKLRDADGMHALRVQGKKLRYGLEIFAAVLPAKHVAKCRQSLEQMQHTLGEFTDHSAAADRFARWARSADAGPSRDELTRLCRDEHSLANDARKSFSKWWSQDRRRSLRRRFQRVLKRRSA